MADTPHSSTSPLSLAGLRREYVSRALTEENVADDPIQQFTHWFQQALDARVPEPNAMALATADVDGRPSGRIVLLKGFDSRGFVFFTNYESRKGHELSENPRAALVFYWHELERQVRVEGDVGLTSDDESSAYFESRPAESRIGAWASDQSRIATNREEIDERQRLLARRFEKDRIPRPPFWGGYRLSPIAIEFWQGRPSRLHDRLRYRKIEDDTWVMERLYP